MRVPHRVTWNDQCVPRSDDSEDIHVPIKNDEAGPARRAAVAGAQPFHAHGHRFFRSFRKTARDGALFAASRSFTTQ
jgi:hypothetical protein